jgi:hypothetical protein
VGIVFVIQGVRQARRDRGHGDQNHRPPAN